MTTLDEVLANYTVSDPEGLKRALTAREDGMRDIISLAGAQFGLYPAIVAEVIAQVGLGTEPSEEERDYIRTQFVALMEELQRQHREGQHPEPPPAPPPDPEMPDDPDSVN